MNFLGFFFEIRTTENLFLVVSFPIGEIYSNLLGFLRPPKNFYTLFRSFTDLPYFCQKKRSHITHMTRFLQQTRYMTKTFCPKKNSGLLNIKFFLQSYPRFFLGIGLIMPSFRAKFHQGRAHRVHSPLIHI